ncbi:uncharacterized protein LOC110118582 [Ceratitis capitata]|uniref:uncharacterized protein LOC110118582 n=1 Tax=Ceratitis capitata TaxID=7213 RepID=UPI000A122D31|nr:uncharacterized protein LOC110118582 [Ceratitis capitata]
MLLLRFLTFQRTLCEFLYEKVSEFGASSECTTKCRQHLESLRHAIELFYETQQLLRSYVDRFAWFGRLVVLASVLAIYFTNQIIICFYVKEFYGLPLPNACMCLVNMLYMAALHDWFAAEEEKLNHILISVVAELSKRRSTCTHCGDLLKLIDMHFCGRNVQTNIFNIFQSVKWSKLYVVQLFSHFILMGINMTQFDMDNSPIYSCRINNMEY